MVEIRIDTNSENKFKGGMCELEAQIIYLESIRPKEVEYTGEGNEIYELLEELLKFKNDVLLDYIYGKSSVTIINIPEHLAKKHSYKI